jgi:hypothetical protein
VLKDQQGLKVIQVLRELLVTQGLKVPSVLKVL